MYKEKGIDKFIFKFFYHSSSCLYGGFCRRPQRKKINFFSKILILIIIIISWRLRSMVFDREILWRRRLFVHRRLVWRADRTAGPVYRISRRLPPVRGGVCAAGINQAYRTCCAHGFATNSGDRTSLSSRRATPPPPTAIV